MSVTNAVLIAAFVVSVIAALAIVAIPLTVLFRRRTLSADRAWMPATAFLLSAAVLTYDWGFLHMLVLDAREDCYTAAERAHLPLTASTPWTGFRDSLSPLSAKCSWQGLPTIDLVPGYVNPMIVICLLAAAGTAAMAVRRTSGLRGRSAEV